MATRRRRLTGLAPRVGRALAGAAAAWLAVSPGTARAARPLVTDDAAIEPPGSCHLDVWGQSGREADEFWFSPACTVAQRFEVTLASGWVSQDGGRVPLAAQIKTPLARDLGGSVDLAISGAVRHDVAPGVGGELGSVALNLPATARLLGDALLLDVNVGMAWDGGRDRLLATYGTAFELAPWHGLAPMLEVYGDQRSRPVGQVALRWWLVPDRFALNASFGAPIGRARARTATLGVELYTGSLR